jgi:hypothetical protein
MTKASLSRGVLSDLYYLTNPPLVGTYRYYDEFEVLLTLTKGISRYRGSLHQ